MKQQDTHRKHFHWPWQREHQIKSEEPAPAYPLHQHERPIQAIRPPIYTPGNTDPMRTLPRTTGAMAPVQRPLLSARQVHISTLETLHVLPKQPDWLTEVVGDGYRVIRQEDDMSFLNSQPLPPNWEYAEAWGEKDRPEWKWEAVEQEPFPEPEAQVSAELILGEMASQPPNEDTAEVPTPYRDRVTERAAARRARYNLPEIPQESE